MTEITFKQLKKLSKTDISQLPQYKLAVMGDCATQHLAKQECFDDILVCYSCANFLTDTNLMLLR